MDKNTFRTRYWINREVCKNDIFYKILCYSTHFHQAIKVYQTLINFKIFKISLLSYNEKVSQEIWLLSHAIWLLSHASTVRHYSIVARMCQIWQVKVAVFKRNKRKYYIEYYLFICRMFPTVAYDRCKVKFKFVTKLRGFFYYHHRSRVCDLERW